jgi:hypothetical protein
MDTIASDARTNGTKKVCWSLPHKKIRRISQIH